MYTCAIKETAFEKNSVSLQNRSNSAKTNVFDTHEKSYLTFANQVALSLWNNENCCQIVATSGFKA